MAVFSAILVPAGDAVIKIAGLGATTSTAEQTIGQNKMFAINATQDVTIKFGNAGMAAASATDFRVPANQTLTFSTSAFYQKVRVFNLAAATADVYIQPLVAS